MRHSRAESLPVTQWVFITGTRKTTPESVKVIKGTVSNIMRRGGGIVVGAGAGSDVAAIQEGLRHNRKGDRVKVFLIAPMKNIWQVESEKEMP